MRGNKEWPDAVLGAWETLRQGNGGYLTPSNAPHRFTAEADVGNSGRVPQIVTFCRGEVPIAIMLGWKQVNSIATRIGYIRVPSLALSQLAIVHGGIITDGSSFAAESVARYLISRLQSGDYDTIHLSYLRTDRHPDADVVQLLDNRFSPFCGPSQRRWLAGLVDEAGTAVKHHSGKTLATLRRKDRRLVEQLGEIELVVARHLDEMDRFLRAANLITARTYHSALGAGLRDDPLWRAILSAEAKAGRLFGAVLFSHGHPIAYTLGLIENGMYFSEAMGYDPQFRDLSPGGVLLNRVLQRLPDVGVRIIDFGFGDADYKQFHGTTSIVEHSRYYLGKGLRPRIAGGINKLVVSTSRLATHCLQSVGAMNRVKRYWRRRLESR